MTELTADFDAEVNELLVADGSAVQAGDPIIAVSVCKMLSTLPAPADGIVNYCCKTGDYVTKGDVLARVE